jgi:hypothetical protein
VGWGMTAPPNVPVYVFAVHALTLPLIENTCLSKCMLLPVGPCDFAIFC